MKIAICDDDLTELNRITAFLDEYSKTNRLPLTCKTFCSSIELASTAMQESYDLYLLDILMPALNGIELAREIRNFDRAADLIFLTSSPEYAVDSYTVKASDYLLKPVQKKRFFAALDDILEQKERLLEKSIVVKSTIGVHKILLSRLMYVEAFNRRVVYYLLNGEHLECTERFSQVCDNLMKNPEFILPHRSFLVNMNFIRSIAGNDMTLANGMVIPLAQRRITEIKKHYLAFQMEEVSL